MRRLSATEWERAQHGAGQYIQGATLRNSSSFYIDTSELLRAAVDKLRVPAAFTDGVEIAQQVAEQKRAERIKLKAHQFEIPTLPDKRDWAFAPGCFCHSGQWYKLRGVSWRVLKTIVEAERAIDGATIAAVLYEKNIPSDPAIVSGRVGTVLSILRGKLREAFGLESTFDPIPCVSIDRLNGGGNWTVFVPSTNRKASA